MRRQWGNSFAWMWRGNLRLQTYILRSWQSREVKLPQDWLALARRQHVKWPQEPILWVKTHMAKLNIPSWAWQHFPVCNFDPGTSTHSEKPAARGPQLSKRKRGKKPAMAGGHNYRKDRGSHGSGSPRMFLLRIALYETPFPSQLSLASQNPDMERCFLKNLCDCKLEGPGWGEKSKE